MKMTNIKTKLCETVLEFCAQKKNETRNEKKIKYDIYVKCKIRT